MSTDLYHAMSSAKQFGGEAEEYLFVHRFFDESKHHHGDFRHRALRHHTLGIAECVEKFGDSFVNSEGSRVSVRQVAEQHVKEDHGYLPSVSDWLSQIRPAPWMTKSRKLSREFA